MKPSDRDILVASIDCHLQRSTNSITEGVRIEKSNKGVFLDIIPDVPLEHRRIWKRVREEERRPNMHLPVLCYCENNLKLGAET